jgi:uncharacterized lipoprotein YmbA
MDTQGVTRCLGPALVVAVVWGIWGCSHSDPQRFYLLQPTDTDPHPAAAELTGLTLGVGPVSVPPYLDRNQLVRRTGAARLTIAEFDRWAEPLDQGCLKTVAQTLESLLPEAVIFTYPWSANSNPQRQIQVDILRFEAGPAASVQLKARWRLADAEGETLLRRTSEISQPVHRPGDTDSIVAAHSEALGALCREIAAALSEASPKQ